MINLILTTSAAHFRPYFAKQKGFRVLPLGKNKDGENIFPDGEVFASLPSLPKTGRFIVLHSGAPEPNRGLAELEMLLSILKWEGKKAEVFFTYMPYSMQDKQHGKGETIAAEDILRKLTLYYGVKKLYVLEPHFEGAPWLTGLPLISVPAHNFLMREVRKKYREAIFVAPDMGHVRRTKIEGVEKKRIDSYTVEIGKNPKLMSRLSGKTVAVVDDIVETGGTMIGFKEACMAFCPKKMLAVVTHGLLPEGVARLKKEYGALILSNSIAQKTPTVDIAPLIAEVLL